MKEFFAVIPDLFFDVIGIFVPGAALLFGIACMGYTVPIRQPTTGFELLYVLIVCYLVGHLLYAASSRIVARVASQVQPNPKRMWLLCQRNADQAESEAIKGPPICPEHYVVNENFRRTLVEEIHEEWSISPKRTLDTKSSYELLRSYLHIHDHERGAYLRKEQAYGELARSMVLGSASPAAHAGSLCEVLACCILFSR